MSLGSLSANGGGTGGGGGGGGSPTGAAGGDLGGTYPNPTVVSGGNLGSRSVPIAALANDGTVDGKYLKSAGGIWVPTAVAYSDLTGVPSSFTPSAHASTHGNGGSDQVTIAPAQVTGTAVITTDSRLSDARTPTAHQSTHLPNGSDSLARLVDLGNTSPNHQGYLQQSYLAPLAASSAQPNAGLIYLIKLLCPYAFTINAIDMIVRTAGTGATSLANCFVALFSSDGTRRFLSADQSTNWQTNGQKSITVTGGYTVTASDYIYVALLVGQQSTTAMNFVGINIQNADQYRGRSAAAAYTLGQQGSGLTAIPASLTLSTNVASGLAFPWVGVY